MTSYIINNDPQIRIKRWNVRSIFKRYVKEKQPKESKRKTRSFSNKHAIHHGWRQNPIR